MTKKASQHPDHLDENTIHEYLDKVLDEGAHKQVEAHLETCSACREEVSALQTLFFDLEALPDVSLSRDLSPLVLDSLDPYPISWQTGRWLVLIQVAVAVLVLVFSWPLVLRQTAGLPLESWRVFAQSWLVGTLETLAVSTASWSLQANAFLDQVMGALQEPLGFSIAGLNIWPWVAAFGLFWLLVNGLVLRPTGERNSFKASNGNT